MRLWYKKGYILLRTSDTKYKGKAQNIYRVRIKLSCKVKVMIKNVCIREPVESNSPKMYVSWDRNIGSAISQQSSWRPKIKKLSDEIYLYYYHIKIRSCDTIVCLFGVRSIWQEVLVSKRVNDPTMSGLALVLMPVRSLLAWSRLRSKREMYAAELSDEVKSEVQASAVCERIQKRESSSNVYWDILLRI